MSHLRLLGPPNDQPPVRSPALAPALSAQGAVPPEQDLQLGRLARRAIDGDPAALATLHAAYLPRLDGWVRRARRSCSRQSADPAIEPEDIDQEAFIVFADLLLAWDGESSLSAYLIAFFPWKLSDVVRAMAMEMPRTNRAELALAELVDSSFEADESMAVLAMIAAELPDRLGQVLHLRIGAGMTWPEIADELGVVKRTVLRDWKTVVKHLKSVYPR